MDMKKNHRKTPVLRLLLLAALAFAVTAPVRAQVVTGYRDGLLTRAEIVDAQLFLNWRFLRPLPTPLDAVVADINGRALTQSEFKAYPQPNDVTMIGLLVDVSSPARAEELAANNALLIALMSQLKPHHRVAVMKYGADLTVVTPRTGSSAELIEAVLDFDPQDEKANRDEAVIKAINAISGVPANRRALFVLTDGYSDFPARADDVVAAANRYGVAVVFVIANAAGVRTADPAPIVDMALRTGGDVIGSTGFDVFLNNPFAYIDSGAAVTFPLAGAFQLPWENASGIKLRMIYGNQALEMTVPATLPAASTDQLMRAGAPIALAVAVLAGIAFAGVRFVRRRRGGEAKPEAPAAAAAVSPPPAARRILATLEDVESGTSHPVNAPLVRIGRNQDNDIVLSDPSVGRFHAVLQQVGDRAFSIVDQSSANGTLVNNKRIDTATLAEGDLITLGSKTLRFHKVSKSGTVAGRTRA